MKHENLFKIYIPEPCHEDWDKMTPNKQGAFCSSCAKTVVDFSNKTEEEIQNFLLENSGMKVCGRFKATQVEDFPKLKIEKPKIEFPGYLFPISYSPVRAFAMALFVVASVAIAGCSNSDGSISGDKDNQKIERLTGAVEYKPDTNTIKNNTDTTGSKAEIDHNQQLMGGVSINYKNKPDTTAIRIDTTNEMRMLGEVYVKPDTTFKNQDTVKTNENINQNPKVKMGMIKKVENKEKKEYLKGDMYIKQ